MSFSSFYSGLSGLKSHAQSLSVIGNNLANVNTIGYKSGRIGFSELFSSSSQFSLNGAGSASQVGMGVRISGVQQLFNQGALQPTEVETDLALQGAGFFTVKDGDGLSLFTRAGSFSFDRDGYLVDPNGFRVQGYTQQDALGNIQPTGSTSDIQIPVGLVAQPEVTSFFSMSLNLNASARVDDPATAGIDEAETFTSGVTVYDSLGAAHDLTMLYTPIDADADGTADSWDWEARLPAADLGATAPPDFVVVGTGSLSFDGQGQLVSPANQTLSITGWANGADDQDVEWRVADANGNPLVTGFAAPSAVDGLSNDGFGVGRLRALSVGADGLVSGVFTNGRLIELAQLAVGSFNNPAGLLKGDGNTYLASNGSGPVSLGTAGTGGRGVIVARALELSTVDITDQFTDLIVAERAYQANTRVITSTDQLTQEALSIKRYPRRGARRDHPSCAVSLG